MKISSTGFVILFLFLVACNQANTNTGKSGSNYYIDAENGKDSNIGLSEKQAFATLDKANSLKLKAGDVVGLSNINEVNIEAEIEQEFRLSLSSGKLADKIFIQSFRQRFRLNISRKAKLVLFLFLCNSLHLIY